MKRKELGITKGEVYINDSFITEVWSKDTKIASCNNGINSSIYRVKTDEEMKSNATLIADAFNTANKCGLLPSEVLEQRDALLSVLKRAYQCSGNHGKLLLPILDEMLDTINQIEQ